MAKSVVTLETSVNVTDEGWMGCGFATLSTTLSRSEQFSKRARDGARIANSDVEASVHVIENTTSGAPLKGLRFLPKG